MNFNNIEDLVRLAKNNNTTAKENLIMEFKPFILNLSKRTFIDGYDFHDIENECYHLLLKSITRYDIKRHRFVAYATSTIKNGISLLIRNSLRRAKTDSSDSLTFDGDIENLDILSSSVVEEDICKLCEYEDVRFVIKKLTAEEFELLDFIILKNNSIKTYSKLKNLRYSTAVYRKNSLLNKLNLYINKLNNSTITL